MSVEYLGEYAWVGVLLAGLGYLLAPILGYRRPRNGAPQQATMQATTMIDSRVARDVLAQLTEQVILTRRMADDVDALLKIEQARDAHDERRRESEHEDTVRDNKELRRQLEEREQRSKR